MLFPRGTLNFSFHFIGVRNGTGGDSKTQTVTGLFEILVFIRGRGGVWYERDGKSKRF